METEQKAEPVLTEAQLRMKRAQHARRMAGYRDAHSVVPTQEIENLLVNHGKRLSRSKDDAQHLRGLELLETVYRTRQRQGRDPKPTGIRPDPAGSEAKPSDAQPELPTVPTLDDV